MLKNLEIMNSVSDQKGLNPGLPLRDAKLKDMSERIAKRDSIKTTPKEKVKLTSTIPDTHMMRARIPQ